MKRLMAVCAATLLAGFVSAQTEQGPAKAPRHNAMFVNGHWVQVMSPKPGTASPMGELNGGSGDGFVPGGAQLPDDTPMMDGVAHTQKGAKRGGSSNLSYHNGPVIVAAKVVPIFWGSYWGSGAGATQASTMQSFYEQFGTNREYKVITQYYDVSGSTNYIGLSSLEPTGGGTAGVDYWYDGTNPGSANVTDANVQSEVQKFFTANGRTPNTSAIYEVFIGPAYYSSSGSSDSCGGPNLSYCAYHSSFTYNGYNVKYSIEPYPSCSGCWSFSSSNGDSNNIYDMQHFACHETREAVTDEDGNAWYDRRGYEADDKCAWTPAPFKDGSYAYQYEWSNANSGCIQY